MWRQVSGQTLGYGLDLAHMQVDIALVPICGCCNTLEGSLGAAPHYYTDLALNQCSLGINGIFGDILRASSRQALAMIYDQ